MSHTWEYEKTVFIGNSDLSGDVEIRYFHNNDEETITIPGEDLKQFIADQATRAIIAKFENMDLDEFFKF